LLAKDVPFDFDDACLKSFETLKNALISAPFCDPLIGLYLLKLCVMQVIMSWGLFLGQTKDKKHHAITYASKTLTGPQLNYATTEKELLVVMPLTSLDLT
jgi:hypothetical protein